MRQVIQQAGDIEFQIIAIVKGGEHQIHSEDSQMVLLLCIGGIKHPAMKKDLMGRATHCGLKPNAHPPMAFRALLVLEGPRPHRIGKGEKCRVTAARRPQSLRQQRILMIQHGDEPVPRNIAGTVSVDGITHLHVVSGNALRHGPGSPAHPEKPGRRLLAGADFREGAVFGGIKIELEGFLAGGWDIGSYGHGESFSGGRVRRFSWCRCDTPVPGRRPVPTHAGG